MNNSTLPNDNHFDKDKMIEEEEEKEEVKEEFVPGYEDNIEEKISLPPTNQPSQLSKEQFRAKMLKTFGIVIVIFIFIILIGLIISLSSKKAYKYSDVEEIMKKAAEKYFKDNKKQLPTPTQPVQISDSILVNNNYMKPITDYIKNDSCTGKVIVKNNDNNYFYSAYLNCGDKYQTKELYSEITNQKNVVTSGYGLYYMNNEYVYRGKNVNNYVKFSDSDNLWRIVKVTSNNEVVLIEKDHSVNSFVWDDRYNTIAEGNDGINEYNNSKISTIVEQLYKNTINDKNSDEDNYYDDETKLLTNEDRKKTVAFNSCVANRSIDDTSKDGSTECSIVSKTKASLLSVYDFLNASLDSNCVTAASPSCQNYNYLSNSSSYWLANGKKEDSSRVYSISGTNYIYPKVAAEEVYIRLVIHLDSNTMLESGKGTAKNPYIIR